MEDAEREHNQPLRTPHSALRTGEGPQMEVGDADARRYQQTRMDEEENNPFTPHSGFRTPHWGGPADERGLTQMPADARRWRMLKESIISHSARRIPHSALDQSAALVTLLEARFWYGEW